MQMWKFEPFTSFTMKVHVCKNHIAMELNLKTTQVQLCPPKCNFHAITLYKYNDLIKKFSYKKIS
jgi:hypothetical protein